MTSYEDLLQQATELVGEPGFQNELAQVQANAVLRRVGASEMPRWTYSPRRMIRNAVSVTSDLALVSASQAGLLVDPPVAARQVAAFWENLATLRDGEEKNRLLLNAAMSYEIAGYQANAACIAKLVHGRVAGKRERFVEELVSIFLQRKFIRLLETARVALPNTPNKPDGYFHIARSIAASAIASGLRAAAQYFMSGREALLEIGTTRLNSGYTIYRELGLVEDANSAQVCLELLPLMVRRSTWKVISRYIELTPRWVRYLKLLSRGTGEDLLEARSVSEFWPSQVRAIEAGVLELATSKVVRMPTSAGKTRIAELTIVAALERYPNAKCVYVAPYKALVSEVEASLAGVLGDLGYGVSSMLGAFEEDEFERSLVAQADVLVVTPEKLDMVFRVQPLLMEKTCLFVIDEGQVIDDMRRGVKLELLVTRLRRKLPDAKFLVISAMLDEESLAHMAKWLGGTAQDALSVEWRPSIQRLAMLDWRGASGTLRYVAEDDTSPEYLGFVPGVVREERYEVVDEASGKREIKRFPSTGSKAQVVAGLAWKLVDDGAVLIFCSQTNHVEDVARALEVKLSLEEGGGGTVPAFLLRGKGTKSWTLAREWLGEEHIVTRMLGKGVAIHHGRLPEAVRSAIEDDFRKRMFRLIVATNTLAQGVNLPIRSVVFHSCWRHNPATERQERISARDYWNIAGRAGRAGEETDGLVVHVVKSRQDALDFRYYLARRVQQDPVTGALYKYMKDLADNRITSEELREVIDGEVLAILAEEAEGDVTALIDRVLSESYIATRISEGVEDAYAQLRTTFVNTANSIRDSVPSHAERRTFSGTGLSSESALLLSRSVLSSKEAVLSLLEEEDPNNVDRLIREILPICSQLTEMSPTQEFGGDLEGLLLSWIRGSTVGELLSKFGGIGWSLEDLGRFIDDMFRYHLPWGFSGFIRIAVAALDLGEGPPGAIARYLPAMIKFGVPEPVAAWAMSAGIPVRGLAIRLASEYRARFKELDHTTFRTWLSELTSEQLAREYAVEPVILGDVVRKVMSAAKNPYLPDRLGQSEVPPKKFPVVGTRFSEERIVAALLTEVGDKIELRREYSNAYDRNAIQAWSTHGVLGYVPRSLAQYLAPEIDAGGSIDARAATAERGKEPRVAVELVQM